MSKKISLDDKENALKIDQQNMLACIEEIPEQLKDCWQEVKKLIIPAHYLSIKNIIVLGMGGSAIGGELVKGLISRELKIPFYNIRDYTLPNFVDSKSLVIASSYSGNTEETLEALSQAISKGAKIIGITTGGKVEAMSLANNFPILKIKYKSLPRAAIGYSIISILGILAKLSIVDFKDEDVSIAISEMLELKSKIDINVSENKNQAKDLAKKIQNLIPMVVAGGSLIPVARRFKGQINENSKQMAFYDEFPELNHNTVMGFDFPKEIRNMLFVLMLQSEYDHPRVKLREQIIIEILGKKKIKYDAIMFTPSQSPFSEMMKMIMFGDYLSYYLAILNNVNPTIIEMIDFLKEKLAKQEK